MYGKTEIEEPLFVETTQGLVPNLVKFTGTDYEPKRDRHRLGSKLHIVWKLINDGKERTYHQLYELTRAYRINDDTAGRFVRKINECRYMGCCIKWNKSVNPITFRCIKGE